MQVYEPIQGLLLLAIYGVFVYTATFKFARGTLTKNSFLVADREIKVWPAAFSIAATWIWAPALFLAAQKAYQQGWVGVFWFTVPNIACLIIFSHFAGKIRERVPQGYTISSYMGSVYSKRVQRIYIAGLAGLAVCSFAVQLLAGGAVVVALTGLPYMQTTIILAVMALGYSAYSGLKASVLTDYLQMGIIGLVLFVAVPAVVIRAGGISSVTDGLSGFSGEFTSLVSGAGGNVFWTFGLTVTLGLMAGPFGDQSFWQRAFATRKEVVKTAFIRGAFVFGIVPILGSLLGFVANSQGLVVDDPQLVNLATVLNNLPAWTAIPFVFMLFSGLVSTLDSNLSSISSVIGHDLLQSRYESDNPDTAIGELDVVRVARIGMITLAFGAVVIANIPGMKILYLFLFYGMIRAATLIPTIYTLLKGFVSESGMFYGVLASLVIGLPTYAIGAFQGINSLKVLGTLLVTFLSGIIVVYMTNKSDIKDLAKVE